MAIGKVSSGEAAGLSVVLGVDLAAQPENTGLAILSRVDGVWRASVPDAEPTDQRIVELAIGADVVGIDAPLGWPQPFVDALVGHSERLRWPLDVDRHNLLYRDTDRHVREVTDRRPLSVVGDLLAYVGIRAARLQTLLADAWGGPPEPRDGSGRIVETYPAGALKVWGLPSRGYAGGGVAAREVRTSILAGLVERFSGVVDLDGVASYVAASDHILDGVVSAIVALLAKHGATIPPIDADSALVEGWIHLPAAR